MITVPICTEANVLIACLAFKKKCCQHIIYCSMILLCLISLCPFCSPSFQSYPHIFLSLRIHYLSVLQRCYQLGPFLLRIFYEFITLNYLLVFAIFASTISLKEFSVLKGILVLISLTIQNTQFHKYYWIFNLFNIVFCFVTMH